MNLANPSFVCLSFWPCLCVCSIDELAAKLKKIMSDETLYNTYLEHRFLPEDRLNPLFRENFSNSTCDDFCRLSEKMVDPVEMEKLVKRRNPKDTSCRRAGVLKWAFSRSSNCSVYITWWLRELSPVHIGWRASSLLLVVHLGPLMADEVELWFVTLGLLIIIDDRMGWQWLKLVFGWLQKLGTSTADRKFGTLCPALLQANFISGRSCCAHQVSPAGWAFFWLCYRIRIRLFHELPFVLEYFTRLRQIILTVHIETIPVQICVYVVFTSVSHTHACTHTDFLSVSLLLFCILSV